MTIKHSILIMNKTYVPNQKQINQGQWYFIDAKNQTLGRISTLAAHILRGKHQPIYTPYLYKKNKLIIINAKDVQVTGNKRLQKTYKHHSGFPGGLKTENFEHLQKRIPSKIIEHAIRGMLPKGPIGRALFKQLKIYATDQHPHVSYKSQFIYINNI